jgi:hypothetical protein
MPFDLATAKLRAPSLVVPDLVIQGYLDAALAVAERYCGRSFLYKAETAKFYFWVGSALQLPRFPVEQVTNVTGIASNLIGWKVHHAAGQVEFGMQFYSPEVAVTYAGGYRILPPDLELALWLIFDSVVAAAQGGGSIGAGAITSISVPDVGTIRMEGSKGASGANNAGLLPASSIDLLSRYMVWVA